MNVTLDLFCISRAYFSTTFSHHGRSYRSILTEYEQDKLLHEISWFIDALATHGKSANEGNDTKTDNYAA